MTWKCNACNEDHEAQFDTCWKCGLDSDGNKPNEVSNAFQEAIPTYQESSDKLDIPCSTTSSIPGREILATKGIVSGEAIMGANFLRDIAASFTDLVGGRSGVYESKMREGKQLAIQDMMKEALDLNADAIIGVDLAYESLSNSMFFVTASGTAVSLRPVQYRSRQSHRSGCRT